MIDKKLKPPIKGQDPENQPYCNIHGFKKRKVKRSPLHSKIEYKTQINKYVYDKTRNIYLR